MAGDHQQKQPNLKIGGFLGVFQNSPASSNASALQKKERQAHSAPGKQQWPLWVGWRKCQCAPSTAPPHPGEPRLPSPGEITCFSFFCSSYKRPNSGIQFWLFSGELLKSCFRVWNPSFRHNLEIKDYSNEKWLQLSLWDLQDWWGKRKKLKENEEENQRKTGREREERRGKRNLLYHELCGALWMAFYFILI